MGYLPYLDRFYTPADARSAFIAVTDACARYGASIVGIPRDNLPVLADADGNALYNNGDAWEPVTPFRTNDGATRAILAMGACGYLGGEAADQLTADGCATDAYVVNGLPFNDGQLAELAAKYPDGLVSIEDGIIAHDGIGLRGFASLVATAGVPTNHVGITDPRIAPSHGHEETWEHFGLTTSALVDAVKALYSSSAFNYAVGHQIKRVANKKGGWQHPPFYLFGTLFSTKRHRPRSRPHNAQRIPIDAYEFRRN